MSFDTPILLMVFNRPEDTRKSFGAIKAVKPKQLYIAADGPRANKPGEAELCKQVRDIVTAIDWDCELHTLFRGQNLGCGHAPAGAITWFFENVERGIIIEDDCIPDASFFSYCEELLERYKDNEQVMHICGNNFLANKNYAKHGESYYFNKYFTAWGWASWRRAWAKYDFKVPYLNELISSGKLAEVTLNKQQYEYWLKIFRLVENGQRDDIWDYQWIITCWYNNAYAITPVLNLVTNIGFGADATHTVGESRVSYVQSHSMNQIVHPKSIRRSKKVDEVTFKNYYEVPQHLNHLRSIMYKIFPKAIMMQIRKIRRTLFPNMK